MTSKLFESQARARQRLVESSNDAWMIGNSANSKTPGYVLDHIVSINEAETTSNPGWDSTSVSHVTNLRYITLIENALKGANSNWAVYNRRKAAWDAGNTQALPNIF